MIGIVAGAFVFLFGKFRLSPWGYAHKIFKPRNINNFLVEDISDPSNRQTLSQEDRTKQLEKELFELKLVIKSYVLDTLSLKKGD